MKCKAPEQMISLAILEQIVDDIRTQEETWVPEEGRDKMGRNGTGKKENRGLFLESPDNERARKAVVVYIQVRGFKRFESNIIS